MSTPCPSKVQLVTSLQEGLIDFCLAQSSASPFDHAWACALWRYLKFMEGNKYKISVYMSGKEICIMQRRTTMCGQRILPQTSVEELKAYFGFMVLMGINQLPEIRDYWTKDPSLHYSPIADRIAHDSKRLHATCTLLTMMFCLLVGMKATTDFRKFYQLSLPSTKHALTTIGQTGRTVLMRL